MSTDSWTLKRERLQEALENWHRDDQPDDETRSRLNEWLMDLVQRPYDVGSEDPEHEGVWFGRVPEANIGVVYVPDPEKREIAVAIISSEA